jgi:hypothetical protein
MKKELLDELDKIKTGYADADSFQRMHIAYISNRISIGRIMEILGKEKSRRTMMREWNDGVELVDALWNAVKSIL